MQILSGIKKLTSGKNDGGGVDTHFQFWGLNQQMLLAVSPTLQLHKVVLSTERELQQGVYVESRLSVDRMWYAYQET